MADVTREEIASSTPAREYFPYSVFVLYAAGAEFERCMRQLPPEWAKRFEHFYLLRKVRDGSFASSVRRVLDEARPLAIRRAEERNFLSAFISYSRRDKEFAQWLSHHLRGMGIRHWLHEKQLRAGDQLREGLERGIEAADRFLLCASQHSPRSRWVESEITFVIKKERKMKTCGDRSPLLIPLNLDGFMLDQSWKSTWKTRVTGRVAPDFTDWKPGEYSSGLESVFNALKVSPSQPEAVEQTDG